MSTLSPSITYNYPPTYSDVSYEWVSTPTGSFLPLTETPTDVKSSFSSSFSYDTFSTPGFKSFVYKYPVSSNISIEGPCTNAASSFNYLVNNTLPSWITYNQ